ncbi:DNA/RNA non-specific endonuclease [Sphingomonas sp. LY54]|uniref:DNA/RNA non-specific endonuclease n=1 Tax=Sphingomonas sp. LY54 TaxID=3095343 RepID=UPI002D7725BC|nr:DNA/RNA non-specific endonuclease [Sphingomonas sp. LY54]WRP29763.1 DNA/RNA non-specific endonuclease [Sphingomonas sp. LY54]
MSSSGKMQGPRCGTTAAVFAALWVLFAGPAEAADSELYTFHCLWGCPVGAPATNDTIVREIYTLSSNDLTKMADWVAYRVTPQTIATSQGTRNYRIDAWIDPSETISEEQYAGAPAALRIDHGHQAPLAAFSGTPFWDDTNYNSNMTPQASALNQGPWQRLEGRERSVTLGTGGPVYVYTGPLYERLMQAMPAGPAYHRVPSGYWKVIALPDGRMTAFIMDQNTPRNANPCNYRVALIQVELRSRLFLFPRRGAVQLGSLDSMLGCTSPPPEPEPPAVIRTN